MGKRCPKCNSTNTTSDAPAEMRCRDCAHSWFTRDRTPIVEEPKDDGNIDVINGNKGDWDSISGGFK